MQPPDGQAVDNTGLISIEIFMEIYFMRMFNITVIELQVVVTPPDPGGGGGDFSLCFP